MLKTTFAHQTLLIDKIDGKSSISITFIGVKLSFCASLCLGYNFCLLP